MPEVWLYAEGMETPVVVAHLIETGVIPRPESLTVLYADTRMEIPPLQVSAMRMMGELQKRGFHTRVVLPAMDDRYFVYMFGRGVPPPKNRFRWCTSQTKIEPMLNALRELRDQAG
jgi:DNA sulfur modification protein DndC